MKTIYFDCNMGAAGDMLSAALIDLFPDPAEILQKLNSLGLPDVVYKMNNTSKCGIKGVETVVEIGGKTEENSHAEHDGYSHSNTHSHGHTPADIESIIDSIPELSAKVKNDIKGVYNLIADAESTVHNTPITDIHFHEVGTMDAVADVTAVCWLLNELSPDRILSSKINLGSGFVKCAHGVLPVPAPAVVEILKGVPVFSNGVESELCTPTGAALLKYFVSEFTDLPAMKTTAVGYGMGKKDFDTANCLRAFWGESDDIADKVIELSCNVDDMTPESVGYATEKLLEGGANDVYTYPVGMKKGRPGIMINVICRPENKTEMVKLIFKHTSTIGIREAKFGRHILTRKTAEIETPYGKVRLKNSEGFGTEKSKFEYDDLAVISDKLGISLAETAELLKEYKPKD